MLPNVVLPALLEVEDGAWKYTVAVSVTGEENENDTVTSETTHCRNEWLKAGGCVSQSTKFAEGLRGSIRDNECYNRKLLLRAHYRCSSTSLATKRENGWEGSSLGPAEENVLGPIEPETSFKAQSVRAQRGRRSRGLHAGPNAPQVHETIAASSPSLQRCWCFANKRGALWKQVISGKYGVEKVGWSSCGVRGAYGHKWRDDEALYVSFPYLVALIVSKEAQVVDVWDSTIEDGNWNPSFSKPFNDWEVDIVKSFLSRI
ncbi:hypothetical protein CK203_023854 [Vitis vinifera]|uniref:Uncharacterized protein n=1 Tax=Vitis vinifera TaxID=29760 RepID=A0A438JA33_VITVI|nr:hypothetical protein CK203_023854 [Vitis vinifera]